MEKLKKHIAKRAMEARKQWEKYSSGVTTLWWPYEEEYIPDVPALLWYLGCSPTAAAMVLEYWGEHGYPNLNYPDWWYTEYTDTHLRIPDGVTYNSVIDGPQPYSVESLGDGEYSIVPELGLVEGPCTLLKWQAFHLSGYQKQVVVSVTYPSTGSFVFEAGDSVSDVIIGWGDASYDSFTVTVS